MAAIDEYWISLAVGMPQDTQDSPERMAALKAIWYAGAAAALHCLIMEIFKTADEHNAATIKTVQALNLDVLDAQIGMRPAPEQPS